jgi:hypothetical protein
MLQFDFENLKPVDFELNPSIPIGTKVIPIDKKVGCSLEYSVLGRAKNYGNDHLYVVGYKTIPGISKKNERVVDSCLTYVCFHKMLDYSDGDYFVRSDLIIVNDLTNASILQTLKDADEGE